MSGSMYVIIKTKLQKPDLDKLVKKIEEKFEILEFDRRNENAPKGKHSVLSVKSKEEAGIEPTIWFCYYDAFGTYQPTDDIVMWVTLDRGFGYTGKTDNFIDFVVWLCELVGAHEFFGGYEDLITPPLIGIEKSEDGLYNLREHLIDYPFTNDIKFKNTEIKPIPDKYKLLDLIKSSAVEKEKIRKFQIYYLLSKKYTENSIWGLTTPPFYKQFMVQKVDK